MQTLPENFERHQDGGTFLTIGEVLSHLKVKARTIYRLIKGGDLPAVRVGRQWRIRQSDLDAWLEGQRSDSQQA